MQCVRKILLMMLLVSWIAGDGWSQERRVIRVETNLPSATVYADSIRLGVAQQGLFVLPAGTRRVRLVAATQWSIEPIAQPVATLAGDTLALSMPFPYYYSIESSPPAADVFLEARDGRERLGTTPLVHRADRPFEHAVVVEKRGYASKRFEPGTAVWNHHVIALQSVRPRESEHVEVAWDPPPRRHRWIDYTAAALAVAGGVVAVHHKFKADRLHSEYQRTGDPALRSRIERLDTRSAIGLGAMQVGIGVIAVRLVLR